MKYNAILRMPTEVVIPIEADSEEEAEGMLRAGNYKCPDFNFQVLENLAEAEAEITIEEA